MSANLSSFVLRMKIIRTTVFYVACLVYFGIVKGLETQQTGAWNRSMCGTEPELHLKGSGFDSSLSLSLNVPAATTGNTCKLRITAPDTHIVLVNVVEDDALEPASRDGIEIETRTGSCPLSAFLPENRRTAVWRVDPCNRQALPEATLVTQPLRLMWSLPHDRQRLTGRRVTLTALGQGEVCRSEGQHACVRIGWTPVMCVADELVCDGIDHCPPASGSSDEDELMCRERKALSRQSWEKIAREILKKFTSKSRLPQPDEENWPSHEDPWKSSTESVFFNINIHRDHGGAENSNGADGFNSTLQHYGPWGYLMLAMLVCGTILMFCGMWECCCRKEKPSPAPSANTSTTAVVHQTGRAQHRAATTVLIIDQPSLDPSELPEAQPPNYEDLDQPPSYSQLFPPGKTRAEVPQDRP